MKLFDLKREIWLWLIMLVPAGYLWYVWPTLPEIIPTHFGFDGKPDDWSHKTMYAFLIPGLNIGIYLMMTFIPYIDPKKKLELMGSKYFMLKLFTTLFIAIICLFIVRSSITGTVGDSSGLFCVLGGFFMFLGNYLQRASPNYFVGFRTPWSLENEVVWKKTHLLGGRLYFIAGLLIIVLSLVMKEKFAPWFIAIIITASAIPAVYSYFVYKQEMRKAANN
jgi:uncharacterized membrane protein